MPRTRTVSDRKVILARLNWQSGGSRIDSMTDGFGGEDFHWEGRAAGKPLKMTIEMGYDGLCDLYVHHSGRWLKTKKQYRKREVERLAEIVLDALESGQTTNPWFLEYRGQEIFTQVRRASLGLEGRTLTAADRSALIRLASTLPKGSPERRAILAGLAKVARSVEYRDIGKSFEVTRNAVLNEKRGRKHKLKKGDVIQLVDWGGSTWDPPVPMFEILEVDPTDSQSEWEPDAIGTGVRGYFSPTQGGSDRTPHPDYIRPFDWRQRFAS